MSFVVYELLVYEVFTALHLGICLICCTAFQTSHQDAVSGRQTPLVIPLSRLVTVGDRSFAVAGRRLWNTLPEDSTSAPYLLVFRRKLKTDLNLIRTLYCSLCGMLRPVVLDVFT